MQIKIVRFLLLSCLCVFTVPAMACIKFLDAYGTAVRKADIKNTPSFKNAKFYIGLCDGKKASSGKSYCVKMFSDSQVHDMRQAVQIAKDYALRKNNDRITCHSGYWQCSDNDDHLLCSTADNSAHYEFVFDDITEKRDATFKKGIANSYCKLFYSEESKLMEVEKTISGIGSVTTDSNDVLQCVAPKDWKLPDSAKNLCVEMGKKLGQYGYYTEPGYFNCLINFSTWKSCSSSIVDDSFRTLQLDLDADTIAWLAGYVQNNSKTKIKTFKCNLATTTCKTGDFKNPDDDILTCYADGKEMNFQFDDLSETKDLWKKASKDATKCISENGVFDGRQCQGISKEACDKLKKNGVDTQWDTGLKACVLKSADNVANIKRATEVASTVGVATGVVVVTVASGGATTPVLMALGGVVATSVSETIVTHERNKIEEFTSRILQCKSRDCIRTNFEWFLNVGSGYIENLTDDEIKAVDDALARQLPKLESSLTEKDVNDLEYAFNNNKDFFETCKNDSVQVTKCVVDTTAILFDFLPVPTGKASVGKVFLATKAAKSLTKTSKALIQLRKTLVTGVKINDAVSTMNNINKNDN